MDKARRNELAWEWFVHHLASKPFSLPEFTKKFSELGASGGEVGQLLAAAMKQIAQHPHGEGEE